MLNAITTRVEAWTGTSEASRCLDDFHDAIREGRHDDAHRLALRHPELVHMADLFGDTALHWAALGRAGHAVRFRRYASGQHLVGKEGDYVLIAARLLEQGADPAHRNLLAQTPLHFAIGFARDAAVARLLLERGADPMAGDEQGNTALHMALNGGADALELARLVREYAGAGALAVRNCQGKTPYDLASTNLKGAEREALLAALREAPGPVSAIAVQPRAAAAQEPPWAIAMRLVRETLEKLAASPDRSRIGSVFSWLPTIVIGLQDIAKREDGAQIVTAFLGQLGDVLAHCGRDDAAPALHVLRRLCAAAPELTGAHPLAWRLYLDYAGLWQRARQWPESVAYVDRAYALATQGQDGAAAEQIHAALDGIERAALQDHLQHWAAAVLSGFQVALHDMESQWRDNDDPLDALQYAAVQLRAIRHAHDSLQRHGAPHLAQAFAELARQMSAPTLADKLNGALCVARQKEDDAAAFRALAAAILAFAQATAWQGRTAYASGWCADVANAVAEPSSAAAVRAYPCGQHLEVAGALYRAEYRVPVDAEGPAASTAQPNWRIFRRELAALRQRATETLDTLPALSTSEPAALGDWEAPLPIESLQAQVTADLKTLIASIADACLDPMLVPAPLRFAVLGLGSMSRADMGPYSDLEYVVVVATPLEPDTLPHAWFQKWRALFEFAFFTLGETAVGGDHPFTVPAGLHVDRGVDAITAHHGLMDTPAALATRLRERGRSNRNDGHHTDQDVAFSLLTPGLAYGCEALARDYAAAVTRALALDVRGASPDAFSCNARQDMALRQLHADVRHLAAAHAANAATLDLKKQFAGPLNHGLTILALVYGYAARRPREILAQLALSRRFTPAFLADYRWALATVQTIRLRTHLRHRCQHDILAWRSLAPDDATALRAVDARVVRPLWRAFAHWLKCHGYPANGPSGVLECLYGLVDFEPALLGFEAAPDALSTRTGDGTPGITRQAVASLVSTLVHRRADAATLTQHYCRVMARTARSQYEPIWSAWRKGLKTRQDAAQLTGALARLPCGDGWRGSWVDAQRAFHRHVATWLVDANEPAAAGHHAIHLRDIGRGPQAAAPVRRYALREEIAMQLFGPGGAILPKPIGQRGTHTLLPVRFDAHGDSLTYWIKIAPENAPHETLVHALDRRLGEGSGTPCSMICKLETPGRTIAALVMEGAGDEDGKLHRLLERTPAMLDGLDAASFTRALLRVMLTNPEDDKADDYFVRRNERGGLELIRVDNERVFFEPEERRLLGANRLQVKSQLYCLAQMKKPLDADVLNDFCKLSPVRLVQSWLVEAQVLHGHYRDLFTDGEIAEHMQNGDMPCLLAVGIADGLEQELVKRIDSIQGVIRLAQNDGTTVDGMMLLDLVQPLLAKHYKRAFRAVPVAPFEPDAALARFHWLTGPSYAVNALGERRSEMSGIHAVSRSLKIGTRLGARYVGEMADGRHLTPAQALVRLEAMESRRLHDIVAGVLVGKRADRLRFAELPMRHRAQALAVVRTALLEKPSAYTPEAQQRLLRAIAGVPFQELALSGLAAVLTDDLLEPILGGASHSLRSIDLSGCWQLTQDSMAALGEQCPNLRALRLRSLNAPDGGAQPALKALRKPMLSVGVLRLPQLRTLDVGDCRALVEIHIDAPQLETLAMDDCTSLVRVQTGSQALTTLAARNCPALPEAALAGATNAWHRMRSVQLQDCIRFEHIAFRERYPWMADRPWNAWSESQMARWEADLNAALASPQDEVGISTRARVRAWLDSRDTVISALSDAIGRAASLNVRLALARALDKDGDGKAFEAADAALASASASQSLRVMPEPEVHIHLDRMESDDWQIRLAAARALGHVGGTDPDRCIPALLTALRDRDDAVVAAAATALSRLAIWPSPAALTAVLRPWDETPAQPQPQPQPQPSV